MIETLYRLSLTGLLVLVAQGSSLQIVVGFCFAVCFFMCYEHFKPFHDPILQKLQHISLFQVASIFFIALTIKANFVDNKNIAINALIVIAVFLNFIIDVISFIWNKFCAPTVYPFLERSSSFAGRSTFSDSVSDRMTVEAGAMVMSVLHTHDEFGKGSGGDIVENTVDNFEVDNDFTPSFSSSEDILPIERQRGSSMIEMSPRVLSIMK